MRRGYSHDRRVLVAGGAGFLRFHLGERLIALADEVFCLDNFHPGTRGNVEPLLREGVLHTIDYFDAVLTRGGRTAPIDGVPPNGLDFARELHQTASPAG